MKDTIKKRENIRSRVLVFMYESSARIVPFPFIERDEIATCVGDLILTMKDGDAELDFAIEYLCDKDYITRERRRSDGLPSHAYCVTSKGIDIAEQIIKGAG
jgi:hypothetical protein